MAGSRVAVGHGPRCGCSQGLFTASRGLARAQLPQTSRRRVLVSSAPAAPAATEDRCSTSTAVLSEKYAVIEVAGSQQYISEGTWFACSSSALQATTPGASLRFDKVIALRNDGEFLRGRPYLSDVVVEAEFVEEFAAPARADSGTGPKLGKVLVTRIRHSEHARRVLEETFRV